MIRSPLATATALAALLAAPAFAQMGSTTATPQPSSTSASAKGSISATAPVPVAPSSTSTTSTSTPSSTTQINTNAQNPASKARQAAIDQGRTPLCSELDQPNAGKLANKTTGKAVQNSASAVHMDCIADGTSTTAGPNAKAELAANARPSAAKKKPAT